MNATSRHEGGPPSNRPEGIAHPGLLRDTAESHAALAALEGAGENAAVCEVAGMVERAGGALRAAEVLDRLTAPPPGFDRPAARRVLHAAIECGWLAYGDDRRLRPTPAHRSRIAGEAPA